MVSSIILNDTVPYWAGEGVKYILYVIVSYSWTMLVLWVGEKGKTFSYFLDVELKEGLDGGGGSGILLYAHVHNAIVQCITT